MLLSQMSVGHVAVSSSAPAENSAPSADPTGLDSVLYTGLCFHPHVLILGPMWKEIEATAQEDLLWQWQVGERKRARPTGMDQVHQRVKPRAKGQLPSTLSRKICKVTWQWALDP